MKRKLEKKSIYAMICTVVGIATSVFSYQLDNLSEAQAGFMVGFGISLSVVGFILLIRNLTTLSNPSLLKAKEIEVNDERNIQIYLRSMAITFRICILLEAIGSIVLVIMDSALGLYLGTLVGIKLLIFLVSYLFVSKKI